MASYPAPLDRLLRYGSIEDLPAWPNYLALGLNASHIPELIRMALDEALHTSDEGVQMWAPIHALRALGQLRAVSAAEPLMALFQRLDDLDDDWVTGELPKVFGMFGEPAISVLSAYLADAAHGLDARSAAADSLLEVAQQHPRTRGAVVAVLSGQLERFVENNVSLNGRLVAALEALKAVESAPLIERAFTFDRVDQMVAGDWEDAQVRLGLKAGREMPRAYSPWDQLLAETAPKAGGREAPAAKDKEKAKAKRKQVKQSRKKNRKR